MITDRFRFQYLSPNDDIAVILISGCILSSSGVAVVVVDVVVDECSSSSLVRLWDDRFVDECK